MIEDPPLLRDLVSERIAEMIIRGELAPGERLSEVKLADELGVSRSPVREALRQLYNEGLVIYEPRKGMRVTIANEQEAINFYEYRLLIQSECVRLAAPHISDDQLEGLKVMLGLMEDALNEKRMHTYLQLVSEFHVAIRAACPNKILVEAVNSVELRAMRFRSVAIRPEGRLAESLEFHQRLYAALCDRNVDEAVAVVRVTLEKSLDAFLRESGAVRSAAAPD
jgi:DNA-binding GntR family transcriptional regulator